MLSPLGGATLNHPAPAETMGEVTGPFMLRVWLLAAEPVAKVKSSALGESPNLGGVGEASTVRDTLTVWLMSPLAIVTEPGYTPAARPFGSALMLTAAGETACDADARNHAVLADIESGAPAVEQTI